MRIAIGSVEEGARDAAKKYGLGSGCHVEPRVGERIGSKHKDRNKLVKVEGR